MGRGEQAGVAPACCQLFLRDLGTGRLQELCLTVGPPVLPCLCPLDHHPYCLAAPSFQAVLQSFLWENTVPADFQGLGAWLPYRLQRLQPGEHNHPPVSAAQSELEGQEGLCLVPQLTAAHACVVCDAGHGHRLPPKKGHALGARNSPVPVCVALQPGDAVGALSNCPLPAHTGLGDGDAVPAGEAAYPLHQKLCGGDTGREEEVQEMERCDVPHQGI